MLLFICWERIFGLLDPGSIQPHFKDSSFHHAHCTCLEECLPNIYYRLILMIFYRDRYHAHSICDLL